MKSTLAQAWPAEPAALEWTAKVGIGVSSEISVISVFSVADLIFAFWDTIYP